MRRVGAISAGLLSALLIGAGSAMAFEQTPEAPVVQAAPAVPAAKAPAAALQSPAQGPASSPEKKSATVFGFSLLPKLDFGLELLFSQQPGELPPSVQPEESDDLTVLGKVKRSF
jgi:hypothetical protein